MPQRLRAITAENSRNCHNRRVAEDSQQGSSRNMTTRAAAREGVEDRLAMEEGFVDGEFMGGRARGAVFVAMWSLAEVRDGAGGV